MTGDKDTRTPAEQLEQELEKLRADFAKKLPERLKALVEHWQALNDAGWDPDGVRSLHRSVHGLVGTAGSLGFTVVTKMARRLEHRLTRLLQLDSNPSDDDNAAVAAWFEKIAEAATDGALEKVDPGSVSFALHGVNAVVEPRNLIVVVEKGEPFSKELAQQLEHFGFELQVCGDVDNVDAGSSGRMPAAVILEMSSQTDELKGVAAAKAVRDAFGESVPVVFFSGRSDIEARLDAVRAGCSGFFVKPVHYRDVLETLDRITRSEPETYRILIVDDEEDAAEYYSACLRAANLSTAVVTDPLAVSSQLVEFQPDVILMDVYMPGCSGVELAMVIRQEEAFVGVPIVFLSRETDRSKQITALGEGGDDFFTKPVEPNELVSVISARAKRGRTLRTLMERDGLTGLYSHSRIVEQIESAVRRADRQTSEFSVAMLDIDGFKAVNDTYGHLVGDQALKALAYLLRQHLRLSDVIGRFGGDEFAILLPDTDGIVALGKMEEIRRNFAAIDHETVNGIFSVTVSCGVAAYPTALSCQELIAAADDALYGAKRAGRNRVVLAGEDI
jgi:diguanylate cyclase (GGDEF)-like protein